MNKIILILIFIFIMLQGKGQAPRQVINFNKDWKFILHDSAIYKLPSYNDNNWRKLALPHDWSIEGSFDVIHPAGNAGGALPGGIAWYRKSFSLPIEKENTKVYVEFDGIYMNSEVWINGHYLGKWPYGYTAFYYELTPYLLPGNNVIAVRVDNSEQPNSRWYSGSGIYRDVHLVITNKVAFAKWGIFLHNSERKNNEVQLFAEAAVQNAKLSNNIFAKWEVYDSTNKLVATIFPEARGKNDSTFLFRGKLQNPQLWSPQHPYLYKAVFKLYQGKKLLDQWESRFGIRYFHFDANKGFYLNGNPTKILGVCMHHDLGALGAAFNESAARRQLRILKEMGVNAIRISHNPPAAKYLDLCDEMGFLVMDEAFDMWAKKKNKYDYFRFFNEWHQRDLEHMVKRDRNHPSVFMWSIGNEIREQFDSTGITLTKKLVDIVKALDTTRPVTCALSENRSDKNMIYQSKALDVLGFNYHIESYEDFPKNYPGEKFIASEVVSGLASRGHYDMPSDSLRFWPPSSEFKYIENGNPDYTVSAYDNVTAYWGSSHEQTWRIIKKHDYLSGLFVWSGFDFLGEPVPYPYPARSSYYGIVDLAGFPKDVYYMYQSEWTSQPVLHVYPHWNWELGQLVDVKAYYNQAETVELFLNGKSLGRKSKSDSVFHVMWRVPFEPGELKAVSYDHEGKKVLEKTIRTAGTPYKLEATIENSIIDSKNNELSFITIRVLDKEGNLVPDAAHLISVKVEGAAKVEAMDNGNPSDLNSMRDAVHHAYKGMALAIIKGLRPGVANIKITSAGLIPAFATIRIK